MYLLTPFCIKVTNKADIWALGIVLYQWAYNEKHPYESLPGGKISRIKGSLISELFLFWLKFPKKVPSQYPVHYSLKEKMLRMVIWHFLGGDLSQSEKLSEIKPPLKP